MVDVWIIDAHCAPAVATSPNLKFDQLTLEYGDLVMPI
jgi:hypothetical protein